HAFSWDDVLAQGASGQLFQKYLYFSATPAVAGPFGTDTYEFVGPPRCSDGIDDDGDGKIDWPDDPGCANALGAGEDPECDDGIDDDGDGAIDWPADPGCRAPWSASESPRCNDGIDNDGDGKIDLDDPQCGGRAWQNSEATRACGLGFELAA